MDEFLEYAAEQLWEHMASEMLWMKLAEAAGVSVQDSPLWPATRELLDVIHVLLREDVS